MSYRLVQLRSTSLLSIDAIFYHTELYNTILYYAALCCVVYFRPVCNHPDNLDVISSLVTLLSAFVTSGHLEKALDHANK